MPEIDMDVKLERINLLITKECNLWCRMCDYRMFRKDSRELTFQQIQTIIGDARDLGVKRLEITGGEPMIRREVYDMMRNRSTGISGFPTCVI